MTVVGANALSGSAEDEADQVGIVAVPEDHRVLAMPIDERVPPLAAGDLVDLYLAEVTGIDDSIGVLDDPGLVISVDESAFSVALLESDVGLVADAIRNGGVLVVRR